MKGYSFIPYHKAIDGVGEMIYVSSKNRFRILAATYKAELSDDEKKKIDDLYRQLEDMEEALRGIYYDLVKLEN